ncbi:Glycosyltransferase involved in cell wall bisynthesis [Methylobacterium sp. UNC378MF]|uniref:glycosyltransferase n=1 Tax=Methylobacterium sp. UNC378MF TaxID=1502748 RepID=UPI00087F880C|nr:glycosyltransferase [Methylobacterium sp. UNC378MF]SDA15514.1 Glycosyltransferase involved in cell wall bisynthesis [Methylobacterium sp. UNC378MF]
MSGTRVSEGHAAAVTHTQDRDRPHTGTGKIASPRPRLVCFSHLRWGFVWQRPQHLLVRAAQSFDVLFIEEPVFEAEDDADRLRIQEVAPGVVVAVPVLSPANAYRADRLQADLIRDHLRGRPITRQVFWYYTPAAISISADLPRDLTIYDNMDELSAFQGASPELIAQEADLLDQADLVFTGGRSLYEAKRDRHDALHCFPSSVDAAHFHRARETGHPDPEDQAGIPHPRLGFFGVIDERLDRELLAAVADQRPDWHVVMIGPVVKIDPASLPRRPNIHWLGPKSYAALPDYLRHWDLGFMPFAQNEATRFISPTKTPEFLAAGLQVVSTPIVDVVRDYGEAGLVAVSDSPSGIVLSAEALFAGRKEFWRERVDQRLASSSWDGTWQAMHDLIRERLQSPAPEALDLLPQDAPTV